MGNDFSLKTLNTSVPMLSDLHWFHIIIHFYSRNSDLKTYACALCLQCLSLGLWFQVLILVEVI